MEVIALANQKGGVGKTTTTINLGVALAKQDYKVLLVDGDPQGNLTTSLGYSQPDEMKNTLATMLDKVIRDEEIRPGDGIWATKENVDLVPGNIELAAMDVSLAGIMNRERIFSEYLNLQKGAYDYVLIDCMPSLGMLTINSLTAANSVLIPVQANFLPTRGFMQLLKSIQSTKKYLNPKLEIKGALLTLVQQNSNHSKEISAGIRESFGKHLRVFNTSIPRSVRAAEAPEYGKSIFEYDPNGKVADAYMSFAKEVIEIGKCKERKPAIHQR